MQGGYGITACDNTGNAITSTSDYIYQFKKGTTAFAPSFSGTHGYSSAFLLDGWMFRVNGKLPVQAGTGSSSDPQGRDIVHTPIADGDVIMFYMDYPWKENGVRQSVRLYFCRCKLYKRGIKHSIENLKLMVR